MIYVDPLKHSLAKPVVHGFPSESLELCYELFLLNKYKSGVQLITFQRRADGQVDQYIDGVRMQGPYPQLLTHAAMTNIMPKITYHGQANQLPPGRAHEFVRRWINHIRAQ